MNKLSEKMLRKWRKEALQRKEYKETAEPLETLQHFSERILRLTQELLDNHLLSK